MKALCNLAIWLILLSAHAGSAASNEKSDLEDQLPDSCSICFGPRGLRGYPGRNGSAGPQGVQGNPGSSGPPGQQGPAGPPGPAGGVGPAGPAGPPGNNGVKGDQGNTGPVGPPGNPGTPASSNSISCTNVSSRGATTTCPTGYMVVSCACGMACGSWDIPNDSTCHCQCRGIDWTSARCCKLA